MILVSIMGLTCLVSASEKFSYDEFEYAFNERVIYEKGNNLSEVTAQKVENKDTVYGAFIFPDAVDTDYYKIVLDEKSHILIHSENQFASTNLFLTLWSDHTIVLSSQTVQLGDGGFAQIMGGTLNKGIYYLWVGDPLLDGTNNVNYMFYYEAIPAEKNVKKYSVTDSGFANFKKIYLYEENHFADVPSNSWYANDVRMAYEMGLVNGVSNTIFNPNGEISIAETIALAARLHSIYYTGRAEFEQTSLWYNVYVNYAIDNKIIKENEFSSYFSTATRAQFAAILSRALPKEALPKINTVEEDAIPDVLKGSKYIDEIYLLYRAGVLTGNDEMGTFGPDTTIQRSAVATIVSRMAIANQRQSVTLLK